MEATTAGAQPPEAGSGPTIAAPTIAAPTIAAPTITAPTITAPTTAAPTIAGRTITAPAVATPTIGRPPSGTQFTVGIVHYRHGSVCVTDQVLICNSRRYAIDELDNVRTVRAPLHPMTISTAVVALGAAIVIVLAAPFLDPAGWLGALVVLAVPLILLVASMRHPRPYELWAEYHNLTVQLLWDSNSERYHQICRALLRAKENGGF